MNKSILILSTLLIFALAPCFGQQVVDVGNIDYIENVENSREIYLLKLQKNDLCKETRIQRKDNSFIYQTDIEDTKWALPHSEYMSIDTLKSLSINQWNKLLNNKSFILHRDKEEVVTFSKQSDAIVSIAQYLYRDWHSESESLPEYDFQYNEINIKFYNYVYIKLKKNKYTIALIELDGKPDDITGYIMPFADSLRIMDYKAPYDTPYQEIGSKIWNYAKMVYFPDTYKTVPKGNKMQLTDYSGAPLPLVADSIFFLYENIATFDRQTNHYSIYNPWAQRLPIENIRAVAQGNHLQILIDNKLAWIKEGKLTDTQSVSIMHVCGTVAYYKDSIYTKDNAFYFERNTNNQMVARDDKKETYKIDSTADIDSIFFRDRKAINKFSANNQNDMSNGLLYIKKKNGKYNICTFTMSPKKGLLTLTPKLAEDCDIVSMRYPTYFRTNNLMGYYPAMTQARFAAIPSINDQFLRYRKTDGEEGWMVMKNNKEYPDI